MKDDNLVDQLYDNFKSQSVDFSKYWEPNKYEDSFSLTSLIQNLFDFDSDITDYEQPQKTSHSSNDEKISRPSRSGKTTITTSRTITVVC